MDEQSSVSKMRWFVFFLYNKNRDTIPKVWFAIHLSARAIVPFLKRRKDVQFLDFVSVLKTICNSIPSGIIYLPTFRALREKVRDLWNTLCVITMTNRNSRIGGTYGLHLCTSPLDGPSRRDLFGTARTKACESIISRVICAICGELVNPWGRVFEK